jgi:phosphoesterase RecJ-like protein
VSDIVSGLAPAPADALLARVRGSKRVVLTGPEGPDGDSIGACLALRRVLAIVAPGVQVDVVGAVSARYRFLHDFPLMLPNSAAAGAEGVVVLDGDCKRLPAEVTAAFAAARWTGLIDHHHSTDIAGYTVSLLDAKSESTCGMVAGLAAAWGVPLGPELAELLYMGVVFDTGAFRYSNTKPSTHRLAADLVETGIDHSSIVLRTLVERRPAALRVMGMVFGGARFAPDGRSLVGAVSLDTLRMAGAKESDLDGVVDVLQHIEGVEVAALVTERKGIAKISLRSRGALNVATIAQSLNPSGGGHAKAAGCVVPMDEFDAFVDQVVAVLEAATRL